MNPLLPNCEKLVVVDVESTGANPFRHKILSLAMVPLDSDKPSLELYIRNDESIWGETALRYFAQFKSNWESEAICPREAIRRLKTYLTTHFASPVTVIGHNVGFDVAFLKQLAYFGGFDELPLISHRVVDTHTILFLLHMYGLVPQEALTSTGAFAHFGISPPIERRHCAIGDALATRELFMRAVSLMQESVATNLWPSWMLKGNASFFPH